MTTPHSGELQVVRGSLRKVADIWDQQGNAIGAITSKAAGMRLDRLDAGVFQLIVTPYDQVVGQVAARCREGRQRMDDIAGHCADPRARMAPQNTTSPTKCIPCTEVPVNPGTRDRKERRRGVQRRPV